MATIEEALVPLYMYHRYAVEAAASAVGGQDYIYAFRGDGRTPTKWVPAAQQRAALDALVATLKPSELALPKNALDKIPPRPVRLGHASRAVRARIPATLSIRSVRRRPPPTSRLASFSSPIAPRAWSRSTRSIRSLPGLDGCHRGAAQGDVRRAGGQRPTSRKSAAPPRARWSNA